MAIHCDQSDADKAMGLRYTAIYSGDRKMDGWAHAELSYGANAAAQASIDHCRGEFAALVGRQGRMSAEDAMKTEAGIYHDQEAVTAKLADEVGTFEDVLGEMSDGPRPGAEIIQFGSGPPRAATARGAPPASLRKGPSTFREFATEVSELCMIAGLPEKTAVDLAFAHTNITQVRHEIINARAAADEALAINGHMNFIRKPDPASAWDKTVDELNKRGPPGE